MGHRPLLYVVLALAFSLAGCTSDTPGTGGGSGGDGSNGEEEAEGPFSGLVPGVDQVPVPFGSRGVLQGVVYDVTTGEAVADATVTVFCARGALPDLPAEEPSTSVPVKSDGSFSTWIPVSFVDCVSFTYEVEAAGYTLAVPLESGPVKPPEQQHVNAGMVPV